MTKEEIAKALKVNFLKEEVCESCKVEAGFYRKALDAWLCDECAATEALAWESQGDYRYDLWKENQS